MWLLLLLLLLLPSGGVGAAAVACETHTVQIRLGPGWFVRVLNATAVEHLSGARTWRAIPLATVTITAAVTAPGRQVYTITHNGITDTVPNPLYGAAHEAADLCTMILGSGPAIDPAQATAPSPTQP